MPSNNIFDSQSIRDILKYVSFDSVLLLDLDNTVMESQLELGSDQWFVQLCVHATTELTPSQNPIPLVIALYHEIQKMARAQAVEDVVVKIINTMQDIGIPVIAITARDHCLNRATTRQLGDIGIHLFNSDASNRELLITEIGKPPMRACYENGIIFCGGKDKGQCFKAFLNDTGMKLNHVVMVDDKLKHLEHVKDVATGSNIRFDGIRYGYLDAKVAAFDINKANKQLAAVKHRLAHHVQDHIQVLKLPEKRNANAECYLSFFYDNGDNASGTKVDSLKSTPYESSHAMSSANI